MLVLIEALAVFLGQSLTLLMIEILHNLLYQNHRKHGSMVQCIC